MKTVNVISFINYQNQNRFHQTYSNDFRKQFFHSLPVSSGIQKVSLYKFLLSHYFTGLL